MWRHHPEISDDFRRDQQYFGDRPSAKRRHHAWLKIADMTEAFDLPVISHGVPEIHVYPVGAAPNGLTVEYMPRPFPLWKEMP